MTSTTARPAKLGRVVRPGDADYPVANAGYNLLFTHDPTMIVFAQETQDIVNALHGRGKTMSRLVCVVAATVLRDGPMLTTGS